MIKSVLLIKCGSGCIYIQKYVINLYEEYYETITFTFSQ